MRRQYCRRFQFRSFRSSSPLFSSDLSRSTRALDRLILGLHKFRYVAHEIRGRAHHAFAMWHFVHRGLQFRMLLDVTANFFERSARGFESGFEFQFRLGLGLAESHLHAAVSVDIPFARGL